jgi:uncharacterized protein
MALDAVLTARLLTLVARVRRRAGRVVAVHAVLTLAVGVWTAGHLGVNTDAKSLLAADLPFQRAAGDLARRFPPLDDALLVVVDADTPEAARTGARALAARLAADPARFRDVFVPGADDFFQRAGLLYRSPAELEDFADHIARIQPVLGELTRNPSLASLALLVRRGLAEEAAAGRDAAQWSKVLDQIRGATTQVFADYPLAVSWERIMLAGTAFDEARRQVIVAEPVLAFGELLAAAAPIDAVRAAARDLGLDAARGVRVRITGNPALNYEEMLGLAWDVGWSSLFTFAAVMILLRLAFRSLRLVAAAALTLVTGLVWTAGFAALAVGQLNIVSIAFAVLFIGLGVDFAIHLGMHLVEAARGGAPTGAALAAATRDTGAPLFLCAATTTIGFYAFAPTDYRGVAELGLIAGTGMLVILAETFLLFPALVQLFLGDDPGPHLRPALRLRLAPPVLVTRHPGAVVAVAGVLAAGAIAALPRVRFDSNVVNMRDQRTESVAAFRDLLARTDTSPWSVDVLAPDLPAAEHLAHRLAALPGTARAVTLADWVPADQAVKRETLADVAMLLDVPSGEAAASPMPPAEQIAALRTLRDALARAGVAADAPARAPLRRSAHRLRAELDRFLARVADEPDPAPALASLEHLLLAGFPAQVDRLRRALEPPRVTVDDLPVPLRRRFVAADGTARIQVVPRENVGDTAALERFVDAVRGVAPAATGVAVNILEFGRATVRSLREALGLACLAIGLLLLLIWRRIGDTVLVMVPLVLSGLLLVGLMGALDVPFNFANVIVLPLLLGMGVDSGIHLVQLSRGVGAAPAALLDSTTARAVLWSALTTMMSFGNLALSHHRGIASMGLLLLYGLTLMLAGNLVLLPALLVLRERRSSARARAAAAPAA